MRKVDVLIGVPASGKSSYVKENEFDAVFSSDDYRENLFGTLEKQNKASNIKVFEALHKDLMNYVKTNEDFHIVYDATNLSRKRRIAFYRMMRAKNVEVHAIVFIKTLDELIEHNQSRPIERQVPTDVIQSMFTRLEIPFANVDCDSIEMKRFGQPWFDKIEYVQRLQMLISIFDHTRNDGLRQAMHDGLYQSHNSKYHMESIDEHIELVVKNVKNDYNQASDSELNDALLVAWFHDLGKAFAKQPKSDGYTSYINHENVSATLLFEYMMTYESSKSDDLVKRVAYHMLPFKDISKKKIRQRGIDDDLWAKLIRFNSSDKKSSISEDDDINAIT